MSESVCTYAVARFVPNPVRDEARNFGIVLQCIDRGFLGTRFESDLRRRMGSIADAIDATIVRAYVEEIEKSLKNFRGQSIGIAAMAEPLRPDFLVQLWQNYSGKVQFSEPRGCVAEDPQKELDDLFDLLVKDELTAKARAEKRSSVAREVGQYFRQNRLIGKTKVRVNYPVVVRGQEIPFDFGYRHPTREHEVLIETVDLTPVSLRDRIEALSPTAVKFEILKEAKKDEIKTVSIVKTHPNGNGRTYALEFQELKRHADQLIDLSKASALQEVVMMVKQDLGTVMRRTRLFN